MADKEMINDFQQEVADRKLVLKKDIKRASGNCARMLLILAISIYAIGFAIILGIKIRASILGIDTKSNLQTNIVLGISKDAYNFLVGYLPCIIGEIIVIIIAIKTINIKIKEDMFSQNKAPKMFILLGTISCIGTGMVSSIIYVIYSTILKSKGIIIPEPDFSFPMQRG